VGFWPSVLVPLFGVISTVVAAQPPSPPPTETAKIETQDAPTVDPGRTEVEFSYLFGRADEYYDAEGSLNDSGVVEGQIFTLVATRGWKNGFDVSFAFLWRDLTRDDDDTLSGDVGNLAANLKWLFFNSNDGTLLMSWLPGVIAPIADTAEPEQTAPGQVYWSLNNLFVLTKIAKRFNLSFNAGYALAVGGEREGQRGEAVGNLAAGYQINSLFQPELEVSYSHALVDGPGDSQQTVVTLGAIFNITDSIRLDAGYQETVQGRDSSKAGNLFVNLSKTF